MEQRLIMTKGMSLSDLNPPDLCLIVLSVKAVVWTSPWLICNGPSLSSRYTLLQHAKLQNTAKQETCWNIKDYRPLPKAVALACFWVKPQRSESRLYPLLQKYQRPSSADVLSACSQTGQPAISLSSHWVEREHAVKRWAAFRSNSQPEKTCGRDRDTKSSL